ncbi:hypothetical protein [Kutzneria kofuensis]|uniref:Novel STAND NTPase 3 domain-containing protein n=1 Tax=Kutzneria kofuensis TaxID=103725 RepID=A0A7W9NHN3_9PSEU|nr:hypothetical protein [Kutzneria kofuensis]MBB5892313.1 hypothetical protein [Kutzneria kofuensis]
MTTQLSEDEQPTDGAEAPTADESPAEPPPPAEHDDLEGIRTAQTVYTKITGNVHADKVVFGVTDGAESSRRATGPIGDAEVRAALRWFVAVDGLDQAWESLLRHHCVVLHGPEGIGKRTAALKLLADLRDAGLVGADMTSVSPATSLQQLTRLAFTARGGYLVRDHVLDGSQAQVRAYDARLLVDKLKQVNGYLVITTTETAMGPRSLPELAVTVRPPSPVAVLDGCLESAALNDDVRAQAREHVSRLRSPRDVVQLADRLRQDPSQAFEALRSTARRQLEDWTSGQLTKKDVFTVVTLALVGAQPEPVLDVLVAMLLEQTRVAVADREQAPHTDPHTEVMVQRNRDHHLYTVAPAESGYGRRLRFRSPELRDLTLAELHERFAYELWEPVRRFFGGLVELGLGPEVTGELAFGLARLARCDFGDVYGSFLDRWAGGVALERSTAAMALWFMSDDDRIASLALRTAMNWGENRGLNRAITSAVALGGPLGLRFPGESMRRLCFLALRAQRIGAVARMSLAFLFANAAERDTTSAAEVLTMVRDELAKAAGPGARVSRHTGAAPAVTVADPLIDSQSDDDASGDERYERGWTIRVARAARHMVVAVLGAPQLSSDDPVSALVLRTQPANVEVLGELWADVLCSAPHRAGAIDALRRTLRALEHDSAAAPVVARLGAAIRAEMPEPHRRLRIPELKRAMTDGRVRPQVPRVLVTTLLAAIGGDTTESRS